ncbi:MAG: hypothetical protein A2X12_11710 [Bacteroidetes bacterium GWE2_29_8]|nr:MAG: hypothetical protein A2X12_11710 [Bacteroidetes bacterium GWE2_29_8]OFY20462.1 MAG: hypothetical protein A2X02_02385 [Bacteroidetes bacterium GWF2_29_10]
MGILRFFLALSVIASHAGPIIPFSINGEPFVINLLTGRQAVLLFYIISGFYMSLILDKKYVGTNRLKAFYINRYLRLFPAYIVILILAGFFANRFNDILAGISDLSFFNKLFIGFSNIFIIGSDIFYFISVESSKIVYKPFFLYPNHNGADLLVIPPVFSISIELMFYIICPFFVNNIKRILYLILFAIFYFVFIVILGRNNIIWTYHAFPSSLLFFGLGALAYYLSSKKYILDKKYTIFLFLIVMTFLTLPLLVNNLLILVFAMAVPFIFKLTKSNKWDMFIGELSYPLYLIHFPIMQVLYKNYNISEKVGLYTAIISIIFAIIIHIVIENPINKYREKITARML